jgi:tetratricopeptide (TPR) repeat protein
MSDDLQAHADRPRHGRRIVIGAGLLTTGMLSLWFWHLWQQSMPSRLWQKARLAAAAERWREVEDLSARLTEIDSHNGEAWLMWARAAQKLGDPVASARHLSDMPADNTQKVKAFRALAELQLGPLNAPFAAEHSFREILERDSRSNYAHQRLIFFYAITLQRQELMRQARHAMELQCEPIEAYVYLFFADSLHFTNGPELNRRWLTGDANSELFRVAEAIHVAIAVGGGAPRDKPEVVSRIRSLAEQREKILADLLRRYPHNLELLAWHVEQAIERGEVDRVVELLGQLPREADGDNRCLRYAGWAKAQLGRGEEAQTYYNQALHVHPLDWKTRHLLAELRRREQKFDDVDRLEQLVHSADELRHALDVLPDARSVPPEILERLVDYATKCGDELYAKSLRRQLSRPPDMTGGDG